MRLICPNCAAQYEVPTEVIPENGRDVQCSSCGHTWFQQHPDNDQELADELGLSTESEGWDDQPETDDAPDESPSEDTPPAAPETDDALPQADAEEITGLGEDDWQDTEQADWQDETPQPRRRELDPSVADLLRQEAALEAQARAEEQTAGIETQPDLGLDDVYEDDELSQRERETRERMARMRGVPTIEPVEPETVAAAAAPAAAIAAAGSRRELLPDIEEINSTLRSSTERRPAASAEDHETPTTASQTQPPRQPRRKSGFRRGFSLVLLLAAILLLIYVSAEQISAAVPALKPSLDSYVAAVNSGRFWLDEQLRAGAGALDNMSSEQADPAATDQQPPATEGGS